MASPMRVFILSFSKRCATALSNFRILIDSYTGPPSGALAVLGSPTSEPSQAANQPNSILDSIFDGVLYAVPKHRRSVEKRLFRKHRFTSFMEHGTPKTNIVVCLECGRFKEKGHLCGNNLLLCIFQVFSFYGYISVSSKKYSGIREKSTRLKSTLG
ncbi:39S ribosomal protein L32, mitochondrial-like [Elysia marginata]|uniref:Large ribosomal subunit protein bL32m n=1 Tax=Elysia marginata TaxID=1093978 RepID=A0AAV4H1A9_9GAST|nr:39S ribosomal protein L32, mitochondrial-like [Elysia marginata]